MPLDRYDLENLRKESIRTAQESGFFGFSRNTQETLSQKIALCPMEDKKRSILFFGATIEVMKRPNIHDNSPGVWIEVYTRNISRFFPRGVRKVYNQSWMDHELIGHCGGILSHGDNSENFAFSVQEQLAKERFEEGSIAWGVAYFLMPLVRAYHWMVHRQI